MNGLKFPRDLEVINSNLKRLKVPGGWIVISSVYYVHHDREIACSESMIFLRDQNYEWSLEQK